MKPPAPRAAASLTACTLGLVLSPVPLFVVALRGGLGMDVLSWSLLTIYVSATAVLLARFLRGPTASAGAPVSWLVELPCWLGLACFSYVASGMRLTTGFERLGLMSTLFLVGTLLALPVAILRRSALEQRLARWPRPFAWGLLALVVALACVASGVYLATPARFL